MKKIIAILVLAFPCLVSAQEGAGSGLSYSFAELRFVDVDDGDGLRLGGSFEIVNNWLLLAEYTRLDFDGDVDQSVFEFGGGYVWPFRDRFDFYATLGYLRTDVDTPGGDFDDNGLTIVGGTRGLIADNFEVRGSVNHVSLDDSDTFLEMAVDYHITPAVSVGLSFEFAGDNDAWTVGGRWYFR